MVINSIQSDLKAYQGAKVSFEMLMQLRFTSIAHSKFIKAPRRLYPAAGQYSTSIKGGGADFAETRPYLPSDDVRHIDWKVTARTHKVHTKVFYHTTDSPLFLVLDLRQSMYFGTQQCFKSFKACIAAVVLAWQAHFAKEKVGALLITEQGNHWFKPSASFKKLTRLLFEISRLQQNPTQTTQSTSMHLRLSRGHRVMVFSDFLWNEAILKSVLTLSYGNFLTACLIWDKLEAQLPHNKQLWTFTVGAKKWQLDSSNAKTCENYQQNWQNHIEHIQQTVRQYAGKFTQLATDENLTDWFYGRVN